MALREKLFDPGNHRLVLAQFFAEQFRDHIPGEIIRSGAEAAGDDDEISAFEGFADGLLDGGAGVGNGDLTGDFVGGISELSTEPLVMGVENQPEHEFAAGIDDFDDHGKS